MKVGKGERKEREEEGSREKRETEEGEREGERGIMIAHRDYQGISRFQVVEPNFRFLPQTLYF
jgi:hypothetical protein